MGLGFNQPGVDIPGVDDTLNIGGYGLVAAGNGKGSRMLFGDTSPSIIDIAGGIELGSRGVGTFACPTQGNLAMQDGVGGVKGIGYTGFPPLGVGFGLC